MRITLRFCFALCWLSNFIIAQDSLTLHSIPEVTVKSYYTEKNASKTSLHIKSFKIDSLNRYGTFGLAEALSKCEGVNMLSTGPAIAKPVIRGLYGNRVLILLSGLKFDNQQWQEEHGLGLSTLGISSIELIKGPVGILFGTEAIGGVINLIEEGKPIDTKLHADYSLTFHSNTLGGLTQFGLKKSKGKSWWRFRAGIENHADYSDGRNSRVLNSRFDGYYMKGTFGFTKGKWTSTNNLNSSFNRYGFIFSDIYSFVKPDNRWSRKLNENPSHLVLLNIFSSENTIELKNKSLLKVNFGVQSNQRMENEGSGAISLNMHLLTIQSLTRYEKQLSEKHKLVLSNLISYENNTNFGARKIVPDANMQEANISAYFESKLTPYFIWENGLGLGEKYIQTFLTPTVNGPGKEVQPFTKFSPYYNFFSGWTYFPTHLFNIKFNVSTGVRVANLAELSSNGLHEGVFTYEIGAPHLKNEQIFSGNLYLNWQLGKIEFSISPFANYFLNYVYLAPTEKNWFGFIVYRYKQQNAFQYGSEASLSTQFFKKLILKITYAGMMSKTSDGNYTPFIPAQKITPSIAYTLKFKQFPISLFTEVENCLAQFKNAPLELGTPRYSLWNVGFSSPFEWKEKFFTIGLSAKNLLNIAYYDNLSRFKNYGLLNMGRNVSINLKITF